MKDKKTIFYLGFLASYPFISYDLYQPALPAITKYFKTNHAVAQLTLSLFFFIFGLSQLIWGPLIDYYGRMRTLIMSYYIFFMATLICLLAPSMGVLILGRILQAFAVCCANVVSSSATRDLEDSSERAALLSFISMIVTASPLFAPFIGSLIFVNFGWRMIFLAMEVVVIILLLVTKCQLYESPYWKKPTEAWSLNKSMGMYRAILTDRYIWLSISTVTASYSCIMIILVNASYLVIDNLDISPIYFSILFSCYGLFIIFGNYCGVKLLNYKSLIWNIRFGSSLIFLGCSISISLIFYLGFNLLALAPLLIVGFGVSISNPAAFSLALTKYTYQAASASALIKMFRTTIAAVIAGLTGSIVIFHPLWLFFNLSVCTVAALILSFIIKPD